MTDQGAQQARQQVSEASRGELATTESVTLRQLVERNIEEIAKALPSGDASRYARLVMTELRKNDKLMKCSPQSFIGAVLTAAQLGLEFGPLQQAFMVPYGGEITLQIGYRGWLALMNRSSEIASVRARVVYEKDFFEYEYGLKERLVHKPFKPEANHGPVVGYYCVIEKTNGGTTFEVMTLAEVEKHRDRYAKKSGGSITGPWKDNFDEMAKKTCLLKAKTWVPVNAETQVAAMVDTHVVNKMTAGEDAEVVEDEDAVFDAEIVETDAERADREWREQAGATT